MAKKGFESAMAQSVQAVQGFITPQAEPAKEEVKEVAPVQKKKTITQPKKKASKPMTQTTTEIKGDLVVYTLDQAAEIIHVSKRTLFNYINKGMFPATKVGKSWLITEEKLREFVEKGTTQE